MGLVAKIDNPPDIFKNPTNGTSLELIGAGMRRKNVVFVNVDVYKTALCLSDFAKVRCVDWRKDKKDLSGLSEEIFRANQSVLKGKSKAAIIVHFVRSVTTNQVVDAFGEAFATCEKSSVEDFKNALRESVGPNGVKNGDEIIYYWFHGGGILISTNGVPNMIVRNPEIEQQLLRVYLDPKTAVSPDLVKSVYENLAK